LVSLCFIWISNHLDGFMIAVSGPLNVFRSMVFQAYAIFPMAIPTNSNETFEMLKSKPRISKYIYGEY